MPGSLTSRIRQLEPSLRALDKNSCAVPKDLECKPTDSSSSWRDSRTSLSSSTMNTVGTSCMLITTRLKQKESQNQNVASYILSSPIKRWLTPPDRLYRMMQWGSRAKPRVERGSRGWSPTADARQICMLAAALRHLCRCRRKPGRSMWGIYRFRLDVGEFLREIEI